MAHIAKASLHESANFFVANEGVSVICSFWQHSQKAVLPCEYSGSGIDLMDTPPLFDAQATIPDLSCMCLAEASASNPLLICTIRSAITLRCYIASSNLPKDFWGVYEALAHAYINTCQSLAKQDHKFCAADCTKDLALAHSSSKGFPCQDDTARISEIWPQRACERWDHHAAAGSDLSPNAIAEA